MSVVVEKDGVEDQRFEDVTNLKVENEGIQISTLFEGATELKDVIIKNIDFMGGKVLLQKCS